jgi:D-lactate dehydrogenase
MVGIVSGKYDGSLKAEHGTGRNMAPFVATEWGAEAYAIMRDLKALLDPDNMLNPNVAINDNPQSHVTHLKSLSLVSPQIDKCIECGFCEATARANILESPADKIELAEMLNDFSYAGIDTCAVDGLCATACPVGINTGDYVKHLRTESIKDEKLALWLADNFALVEKSIGIGVTLGHVTEKVIGTDGINSILRTAEKISRTNLPKWNQHIPSPSHYRAERSASGDEAHFIYFPSCISRQLGTPLHSTPHFPLSDAFLKIAQRANIHMFIPDNVIGHCCGMPFASKGYKQTYQATLHKTLIQMWKWSEQGKYPIVIDTTSCTHTLRTCSDDLNEEDKVIWKQLIILDGIEFLHDHLLPKLELNPIDEEVVLHPNCSLRKLGLDGKMLNIAKRCARSATVPLNLGCCAFAGDRGLLFPELTKSATEKETAEVLAKNYDGYYSSNITCEMGMSEATGKDYVSIVYLVEKASRSTDPKGLPR